MAAVPAAGSGRLSTYTRERLSGFLFQNYPDPFIKQGRIDGSGRAVAKAFAVQHRPYVSLLLVREGPWMRGPLAGRAWWRRSGLRAIEAASGQVEEPAGRHDPDAWGQCAHSRNAPVASAARVEGSPSSVATFFWIAMMVSALVSLACKRAVSRRRRATSAAKGFGS